MVIYKKVHVNISQCMHTRTTSVAKIRFTFQLARSLGRVIAVHDSPHISTFMKKTAQRKRRGNGKAIGDTSKHVTHAKQKREGKERRGNLKGGTGGSGGKLGGEGLGHKEKGGTERTSRELCKWGGRILQLS